MTEPAPDPRSLDNLHDIVVPDGVPLWPPAPGWYVLAVVVMVAAVWLVVFSLRRHRALRYRRAALAELAALRTRVAGQEEWPACGREAAALLKRTAMHVYSRQRVAALSGSAWLAFLDDHGGEGRFGHDGEHCLLEAAYGDGRSLSAERIGQFLDLVEAWIRAQVCRCPTMGA